MTYISINAGAILAATLASMAFGLAWYGAADGGRTIRALGASGARGRSALLIFFAEAVFAAILAGALILAPAQASPWTMALGTAFVIWIGFIAPVLLVTHRMRGAPTRVARIDCGHWLGAMLIQAAVLKAIGLQPPPG